MSEREQSGTQHSERQREQRAEILAGEYRGQRGVIVGTAFVCDRSRRKHGCSMLFDVRLESGVIVQFVEARPLTAEELQLMAAPKPVQASLW